MRPNTALAAPVFAALGDETRLHLVVRLTRHGAMSISALTEGVGITRQAVTKHLVVMQNAGLVSSRREGRESLWQVEQRQIDAARACLDQISKQWDEAISRLRDFVEH